MELPLRKAVLDPSKKELGLQMISFVKDPAIDISWVIMNKQEPIKLQYAEQDNRVTIFTPVLIPGQKIYRNMDGEEFNLVFDADTIKQVALKWQQDNLSSKVDTNHTQSLIDGVTFYESALKNNKRNSNQTGFELLPEGTWFLTGDVTNPDTIRKIKSGELTGVSIDGLFKTISIQASTNNLPNDLTNIIYNLNINHLNFI